MDRIDILSIDEEIAKLKARHSQAQLNRLRAEALNEAAKKSLNEYLTELRTVYGLDNLEDARAKLTELQDDLRAKLDLSSANLDSIR